MPHEFRASLVVPLPDDSTMPTAAATLLSAWAAFTTEHGGAGQHEFSIAETRGRPASANGARRGRKSRAVTAPLAELTP